MASLDPALIFGDLSDLPNGVTVTLEISNGQMSATVFRDGDEIDCNTSSSSTDLNDWLDEVLSKLDGSSDDEDSNETEDEAPELTPYVAVEPAPYVAPSAPVGPAPLALPAGIELKPYSGPGLPGYVARIPNGLVPHKVEVQEPKVLKPYVAPAPVRAPAPVEAPAPEPQLTAQPLCPPSPRQEPQDCCEGQPASLSLLECVAGGSFGPQVVINLSSADLTEEQIDRILAACGLD